MSARPAGEQYSFIFRLIFRPYCQPLENFQALSRANASLSRYPRMAVREPNESGLATGVVRGAVPFGYHCQRAGRGGRGGRDFLTVFSFPALSTVFYRICYTY